MNTSKIIKAYIRDGTYSTTEPITQGDYGYILQIEGTELPPVYRVDFSNDRHKGEALPVYGNENGVEVPEELIATGKDIFAFYFYIKENFGKTAYTWKIPNDTRAQNGDREPTPTQQDSIDKLVVRSNEAVERAEQAKADAETAQGKAEDAQEAAETAERNARQSATASAQSAEASARCSSDAQESAEEAGQFTQRAETAQRETASLVEEAQRYVDTAGSAARDAETYANNAYGYARSASESADTATTKAGEASESANIASEKASEAGQSASAASAKATESAQSATNASQSAQTAEQAKTNAQTAQGLAESARDTAVSAKTDAESARDEAQSIVDGISAKAEQIDANTSAIESLEDDRYKPYPTDTASGAIASFSDGADGLPLKSLVVDINPVQDLSNGDPSPTNICPISGWTEVDVEQSGVNVWDEEWEVGGIDPTNGRNNEHTNRLRSKNYIPCRPSATYWFKKADDAQSYRTVYYDKEQTFIESSNSMSASAEFTTPDNCHFMRFFSMNPVYIGDISINYPSTDHDYHPYTGRSITIDLGQTVYGGKLDVLNGVLTVDRAMVILDGSNDEVWTLQSINSYGIANFYTYVDHYPAQNYKTFCDIFPSQTSLIGATETEGYFSHQNGSTVYIRIYSHRASTSAEMREWLASNPIHLVLGLTEPLTIQLTPNQVNSLLGVNNLWADSGDTEVEYRADTRLYIEKLTQPEEDDMIADSAITSGQFFMVGNTLYRALANIASGATITVGTNAQRVSLSDALNLVNA